MSYMTKNLHNKNNNINNATLFIDDDVINRRHNHHHSSSSYDNNDDDRSSYFSSSSPFRRHHNAKAEELPLPRPDNNYSNNNNESFFANTWKNIKSFFTDIPKYWKVFFIFALTVVLIIILINCVNNEKILEAKNNAILIQLYLKSKNHFDKIPDISAGGLNINYNNISSAQKNMYYAQCYVKCALQFKNINELSLLVQDNVSAYCIKLNNYDKYYSSFFYGNGA